ncbi:MAG: ribosome silencing factor [Desulfobacterales bacterium]|nr:ribosome silencing factor [Desulfobacterales bacterium]MDD4072062.1 ribosome silencing factor [Desulfobacterales bacterium]MDD4391341.1 ribosome silencing factor [Desulfobacterales bacterium]
MTTDVASSVEPFVRAARGRKALQLVALDVHALTSVADAFVICSGRSNRQVSAIAEHIVRDLKTQGIRPLSVDGLKEGHWVLIDYGYIIVHVFYEPVRQFYDLESLWSDAGRIVIEPDAADISENFEEEDMDD